MNKRLLLALALLGAAPAAHAQISPPIDPDTKLVTYSEVIQAPRATKTELYARAKLWFLSDSESSKVLIEAEEKEASIVQATGWRTVQVALLNRNDSMSMTLWYTVKIAVQDGRYKYTINGFRNQFFRTDTSPIIYTTEKLLNDPNVNPQALAREIKKNADAAASLGASIKKNMSKPATGSDF